MTKIAKSYLGPPTDVIRALYCKYRFEQPNKHQTLNKQDTSQLLHNSNQLVNTFGLVDVEFYN